MDLVIEFLKEVNIGQLIAMALMFWFFYTRLDAKVDQKLDNLEKRINVRFDSINTRFEAVNARFDAINIRFDFIESRLQRLEDRIERLENRIERLEGRFTDLDKRIFGIEAILHMKDCCVLKSDGQIKKAE